MLKVILVRHGEEEKVKSDNIEYQTNNSNLTLKGVKQAEKLASRLRKESIIKIYTSDIKRALQTTESINKVLGVEVIIDKRLRERDLGDFEKYGDNWRSEFSKLKEIELAKGVPLTEIRPPNGENLYDFRERIKSFLQDLSKENGIILVSAHKGVNTAIINFVEDMNCLEFKSIEQNHTCSNVLSFESGKWSILSVNDTSHLSENEI